jgi:hypothetical protein
MNMNSHTLLCGIAIVLAVVGIIKPSWPVVAVAVLLLAVDALMR